MRSSRRRAQSTRPAATRHADIRRLLAQNTQTAAAQATLAGVLDAIDAFGALEDARRRAPAPLLCYGPKSVRGGGENAPWAGVVIWYRRPGYHRYKTLDLLGIWARMTDGAPLLICGTRTLAFQGAFYNAESVNFHLQRDFSVYYGPDAAPPRERVALWTGTYVATDRLNIRKALRATLDGWRDRQIGRE